MSERKTDSRSNEVMVSGMLVKVLRKVKGVRPQDTTTDIVEGTFQERNTDGTANVLLSDGVIFRGKERQDIFPASEQS